MNENKLQLNILLAKTLLFLSTITLVVLSAYYSIIGLSNLFAGKKLFVAIMAAGFQLSKVTVLSILTLKWKQLYKTIKLYFILSALALVLISSSGIYGYLSQAYYLTLKDANMVQNKTLVLQNKQKILVQRKNNIITQNNNLEQQIKELKKDSDNFVIQLQTMSVLQNYTERKMDNLNRINQIDLQIFTLSDSILTVTNSIDNQNSGTFIQIAKLFNVSIDQVAQFFLFLIIFIFDPLAVLFVIVINLDLFKKKKKNNLNLYDTSQVKEINNVSVQDTEQSSKKKL